jgi:uncharacterized membrane protein
MPTMTAASIAVAPPISGSRRRIESIDLLRGTVILIMALDHVRDYFHYSAFLYDPLNLTQTSVPIFFTRWITHFCAPIFTFLAGTSAFLNGRKKSKQQLSFFLFTRGLWLVVAEVLIITLGWTFNPLYPILILQVIWALGISMMVLSVMIYLPKPVILITGIVLIAAHNLLDTTHVPGNEAPAMLWAFLHEQRFFSTGLFNFFVGYPILPWIGIMLTGYALGSLYTAAYSESKRKKILTWLGLGAIALFVIVRFINVYGDPSHWGKQTTGLFTFLSFLNTTKYPPSLLYILMTLGPALLFLAYTERTTNRFAQQVIVFGRVPMFFYILHIFVIHLVAVVTAETTGYDWSDMILTNWVSASPGLRGYGFNLITVYIIWMVLMVLFYPLCKWYDHYKHAHRDKWWLSYI